MMNTAPSLAALPNPSFEALRGGPPPLAQSLRQSKAVRPRPTRRTRGGRPVVNLLYCMFPGQPSPSTLSEHPLRAPSPSAKRPSPLDEPPPARPLRWPTPERSGRWHTNAPSRPLQSSRRTACKPRDGGPGTALEGLTRARLRDSVAFPEPMDGTHAVGGGAARVEARGEAPPSTRGDFRSPPARVRTTAWGPAAPGDGTGSGASTSGRSRNPEEAAGPGVAATIAGP